MHILFDATALQTGHRTRGVGTYTRELLQALFALDSENSYQLIVHHQQGLPPLPANASLVHLPRPALGRLAAFASHQLLLPLLLARQKADLFHAPGFVAAFSVPGLPWRCPLPLVVTLHDFIPLHVPALFNDKAINRLWYRRQMNLARKAQGLICVSEATRQDALRFLPVSPGRCVVIHEGVDRDRFHPAAEQGLRPQPPFVLFVGGDYPNKNRVTALAAFAQLAGQTTHPHHLVLVGHDAATDAELSHLHPQLDLSRVHRLADLSAQELAQAYRDADLLLFPSTCEGFGLPVLEAMASGTPVITSTASSLPEVAGDAAILVDPYDGEALAVAMDRVLSDRALRTRLRDAGLARAAAFSWQATAQGTLDLYGKIVAGAMG